MRGADVLRKSLFTVRKLDDFVPAAHPLRPIRERVAIAGYAVRIDQSDVDLRTRLSQFFIELRP